MISPCPLLVENDSPNKTPNAFGFDSAKVGRQVPAYWTSTFDWTTQPQTLAGAARQEEVSDGGTWWTVSVRWRSGAMIAVVTRIGP
jgi:hypothetical protein